jgi:putative ABC transport system substrate-binding protein
MVGVADPVRHQVVHSLARPGGNVTGVAVPFADLVRKQLGLLQEAVGRIRRVGVLWNPDNPQHAPTLAAVEDAGRAVGVEVRLLQARSQTHTELEGVFSALNRDGIRALLVLSDPELYGGDLHLFAIRHHVATISMLRSFAQGSGLMAYGPHRLETVRRAAYFVDRILRGTKPGELPVEEPTRYELIVNFTTARALGLTLPQSILGRADEIIR